MKVKSGALRGIDGIGVVFIQMGNVILVREQIGNDLIIKVVSRLGLSVLQDTLRTRGIHAIKVRILAALSIGVVRLVAIVHVVVPPLKDVLGRLLDVTDPFEQVN